MSLMGFTRETAIERARKDLAERLGLPETDIRERVSERDFPDMALGAAEPGEMSAQMISSGWQIDLETSGQRHEYRADKYQLRLYNFEGRNYVVE
jgi:CO/xanthine dehydrogenase Mo-binding subunit